MASYGDDNKHEKYDKSNRLTVVTSVNSVHHHHPVNSAHPVASLHPIASARTTSSVNPVNALGCSAADSDDTIPPFDQDLLLSLARYEKGLERGLYSGNAGKRNGLLPAFELKCDSRI